MIDAEGEIGLTIRLATAVGALGLAGDKFVRAQRVFRAEIPRAEAVAATENARRFFGRNGRQFAAELRHFLALAQRRADIPRQRVVARHAFVRPLEDDHILLAA